MKYTVTTGKQFIKKKVPLKFMVSYYTLPKLNWNLECEMSWHLMDSAVLGKHKFYIYKGFT